MTVICLPHNGSVCGAQDLSFVASNSDAVGHPDDDDVADRSRSDRVGLSVGRGARKRERSDAIRDDHAEDRAIGGTGPVPGSDRRSRGATYARR